MKNFAFGQYYPSGSVVHRLDARIKLILAFLYIVCVFLCENQYAFLLTAVSAVMLCMISRIPIGTIIKSMKSILFILLFTVVINVFFTKGEVLIVNWQFIQVYKEGIIKAVFMGVRIIALILGTSIFLTYTLHR